MKCLSICCYFKFWAWNLWYSDLMSLLLEFLDIILLLVMVVSSLILHYNCISFFF